MLFRSSVMTCAGLVMFCASPALSAAGTTCLCRLADGKSFEEWTLRHHRWACDYQLGYARRPAGPKAPALRPTDQTCNAAEITQFKVWLCISRGCTYPYMRGQDKKNADLERIEKLDAPRKP